MAPNAESGDAPSSNRRSAIDVESSTNIADASLDISLPARLAIAARALDRVETKQVATLAQLRAPAVATAERLRTALAETGLSPSRLIPAGGGCNQLARKVGLSSRSSWGRTRRPLRASSRRCRKQCSPRIGCDACCRMYRCRSRSRARSRSRPGSACVSIRSSVGPRLHTGIDLRDEYGAPVRATAAGRVVTAGWSGGYGNMVEIDHGNGIATRYGHLSSIVVA